MKVFIAGIDTETNTFAALPTGYLTFSDGFLAHGDATNREPNYCSCQLIVWRQRAEERGWQVTESICAVAEPGGVVVRAAYERLRNELLTDLQRSLPFDIVILALHGAMVAEGYDDCEGDLLGHVRRIVGSKAVVGAELDLHCHLTVSMMRHATVLLTYKEYPHVDIAERAEDLFRILADTAVGTVSPTMAAYDCRMVSTFRTTEEPLRGFVDRMSEMEGNNGVLSISLVHGFPWADVADVGAKVLVVTDGNKTQAETLARALGEEIFALRDLLRPTFLTMDAALDEALAIDGGPVVIADVSDNAGCGAPGDSTYFVRRVMERGIKDVASCYYWDPMAVRSCQEGGLGARFALRIGGKCGRSSGDPIDLFVTVKGLAEGVTQRFGQSTVHLGSVAWVQGEGVDIIIATKRTQAFHPEGMTAVGLEATARRIILVKSTQHFFAGFSPIAKRVLYAAPPGALSQDFAELPYSKLERPYWPKVANPFRHE